MAIELRAPGGRPRPRLRAGQGVVYFLLILGALICVLPFFFMVGTSLKSAAETITRVSPIPFAPDFWPRFPRWSNYAEAWTRASFSLYFRNSLITAAVTVAGVLVTSSLSAYAFAKIRFPGSRSLFSVLLATLIIPESVYLVPNFLIVTRLGWYDSLAALTVPFMASAFFIFLLRQFFAQIPNELVESARIDGAGHLRSLFSIVLPLSGAPVFTVAFLAFVGSWNSLQWPLVATRTPRWRPITVGLTTFISDAGPENQLIMAGAVIATLPI
ncbi:MAG TPA: carbohydrate ABC transporter permease, partial [Spirochaetia bacterium]|nr:carbohydrate ABC transporter permease [Spirochaetia bacterium]